MNLTGSILGWLVIISLFITLLNYPIKKINRAASRLPQTDGRRQLAAGLTRFLTGNHRFLALLTLLLLIAHLIVQSIVRWVSLSGLIAASLLLVMALFGGFGHYVRKKKKGAWFYFHRFLAILLVVAIGIHIFMLGLPALSGSKPQPGETAATTAEERVFTLEELAEFDGKEGRPAYVAVDGLVYDVSALSRWLNGLHMDLHVAGEDLSEDILEAPHSKAVLQRAEVVGKLTP